MDTAKLKDGVIIAALIGGAVLVYSLLNKVPQAIDAAGAAVATAAGDFSDFVSETFFGPQRSMLFLTVNFAGGEKHAIPVVSQEFPDGVQQNGHFTFRGKEFVVRDKKGPTGIVEHWAFTP